MNALKEPEKGGWQDRNWRVISRLVMQDSDWLYFDSCGKSLKVSAPQLLFTGVLWGAAWRHQGEEIHQAAHRRVLEGPSKS